MKTDDVALGCAVLGVMAPGVIKTQRDIAEVCGVSHGLIYLIERNALKKLRKYNLKELQEYR